ncbi:polyprenyl synthetase family protein [Motilibacter rhizosphaerae]|uniref:polyprenyl synthetase family protein n=1 Tax=Motilibacter rhizosphaerae TaxID=598652 RepID=UPI0038B3AD8A
MDGTDLLARVEKALAEFLDAQAPALDAVAPDLAPVMGTVQDFLLDGGKRLRPAFAYWGWRGAGGADGEEVVRAASALELLHACALIHDDVMDGSDTRRGKPAVHRRFAALHRGERWQGVPEQFGTAAAVLLGDLCLVWSDTMLARCGLPPEALRRAQPVYDTMRLELMAGQYLDVLEQAVASTEVDRALRVARYKTAKYTIERPLHLGASLAGGDQAVLDALSAYGLPLGEAFQLRDDVLGVFGDPSETGKPAGDDLREGKRTVLVAEALAAATPRQEAVVARLLGDPRLDADGVAALREVLVDTGALEATEQRITRSLDEALGALDAAAGSGTLDATACTALRELAVAATARTV